MGMRRILIIGASGGIGAAVALRLAQDRPLPLAQGKCERGPVELILHGRDEERLKALRTQVEGPRTKVSCLPGDVVQWAEDVRSIPAIEPVDGQPSQSTGVHAIVWCAGICELAAGQMIGLKALRPTLAVNLEAPLVVLSHFYRKGVIQDGGTIVLVGSAAAHDAGEGFSVYAASKGGLAAAARVLGKEFSRRNVAVHCLEPGTVDTPMTRSMWASIGGLKDGRAEPVESVSAESVARDIVALVSS